MKNHHSDREVFRIDDPYSFLTKELLEKEYLHNGLSDEAIAQKYNIGSKATIWRRRKFFSIDNKLPTKSNLNACKNRKTNISKEEALKWLSEGKTHKEIGELLKCSRIVVFRRFEELGLTKEQPQAQNKLRLHEKLTDLQIRFLLGDLLGDGSITSWGMFQCSHSHKQKQYIQYKKEVLQNLLSPNFEIMPTKIHSKQSGKDYNGYYLRTMQNEGLKEMYSRFYENKKKFFPFKYLSESSFDEYSLAVWYMDDGSRSQNRVGLYTFGFGYDGNLDILKFLSKKFNLKGKIYMDNREMRSEDCRHYITFSVEESKKFFALVAPYMLPSFQYKLSQEYRFLV